MKNIYDDKIWTTTKKGRIPLWKWILLLFTKPKIIFDPLDKDIATVCYIKSLFKEIYVYRVITYYKGNKISDNKLKRINEL